MMRTLEAIETELAAAREDLGRAEGTPTEVYSRIVGYYRSVRNWNRGKREEYGERRLFEVQPRTFAAKATEATEKAASRGEETPASTETTAAAATTTAEPEAAAAKNAAAGPGPGNRVLLFIRAACPACPPAKAAASRLGIPVEFVDTDAETGLAEAEKRRVMTTPTAILLSADGREIGRARDARSISAFAVGETACAPAASSM